MNKIEKIHKDFKNALEISEIPVASTVECVQSIEHINKLDQLERLGFKDSKTAKDTSKRINTYTVKENAEFSKELQNLEKFQALYPQYRLIGLNALLKLCAKYDLFIGHTSLYTHSIPDKNLAELTKHKQIDASIAPLKFVAGISTISELVKHAKNSPFYNSFNEMNFPSTYFVIAPRNYFKKNAVVIERTLEIIEKPKFVLNFGLRPFPTPDPIVVTPLSVSHVGVVFQIATAWGEEASDSEVTTKVETNITSN